MSDGAVLIQHWADWPTALAPLMLAAALLMAVLVGVGSHYIFISRESDVLREMRASARA
jgi:hypothetical protein